MPRYARQRRAFAAIIAHPDRDHLAGDARWGMHLAGVAGVGRRSLPVRGRGLHVRELREAALSGERRSRVRFASRRGACQPGWLHVRARRALHRARHRHLEPGGGCARELRERCVPRRLCSGSGEDDDAMRARAVRRRQALLLHARRAIEQLRLRGGRPEAHDLLRAGGLARCGSRLQLHAARLRAQPGRLLVLPDDLPPGERGLHRAGLLRDPHDVPVRYAPVLRGFRRAARGHLLDRGDRLRARSGTRGELHDRVAVSREREQP